MRGFIVIHEATTSGEKVKYAISVSDIAFICKENGEAAVISLRTRNRAGWPIQFTAVESYTDLCRKIEEAI